MSPWIAEEMAKSRRHEARHATRLAPLLTQYSEQPYAACLSGLGRDGGGVSLFG
jgi:hypothetical protein